MPQPIYMIESTNYTYAGAGEYTRSQSVELRFGWFRTKRRVQNAVARLEASARMEHQVRNERLQRARQKSISSAQRFNDFIGESFPTKAGTTISYVPVPPPVAPIDFEQFCAQMGYPMYRAVSVKTGDLSDHEMAHSHS